jgi:hypothetical protein
MEDSDGRLSVGLLSLNHLTWLLARKYFIEYSRRESFKLYIKMDLKEAGKLGMYWIYVA